MDDNKQALPNDENQNESNQYQDILNKYADVINSTSTEEKTENLETKNPEDQAIKPESASNPLLIKTDAPLALSKNIEIDEDAKKTPTPILNPAPETPSIKPIENPIPPRPENVNNEIYGENLTPPENEPPKTPEDVKKEIDQLLSSDNPNDNSNNPPPEVQHTGGNFFKVIFFISLIIFLGVASVLAYSFFTNPNPKNSEVKTNTETPSPSLSAETVCTLNDINLKANETFEASDGCNTCTCNADTTISCTEKACVSTITPTKSASSSASVNTKSYSNANFGISFTYPSTWVLSEPKITPDQKEIAYIAVSAKNPSSSEVPANFQLSIYKSITDLDQNNFKPTSLLDYMKKYTGSNEENIYSKYEITKINNKTAYKADPLESMGKTTNYLTQQQNGKIIEITAFEDFEDSDETITSIIKSLVL